MNLQETFSVAGNAVIVTGGASGLGLAFSEVMAECGANVTMMDMDEARLGQEVERLSARGLTVSGTKLDVTDREALDRAFDEVNARTGRIDAVFANAGIDPGPGFAATDGNGDRSVANTIEHYADERWRKVISVSLDAVFYSVRAAVRHMRPRRSGSVIVTTSISAVRPAAALGVAYMASKAGAAHLVRTVALELAADNVRINAIAPGPFETNIGGGFMHRDEVRAAFAAGVPMRRVAHVDEIKPLALYLASGASSFVTGQQLVIDGGLSLSSSRS
ncbi:SDR family oxidoreductase [Agrobacterium rhizogenes]|uniref:SDR family NAD(P)-dependent oxidoreductase n=1 Tax=Rhizobium rhizogenes TaxID=359 RepID=UPI0015730351|nr:SDR family NAD(P)-dependent oxidoreductase [Rhizobium rhizogenes]NTH16726.1 SDR family oxidoreductase [Rhizobium rhizogenes]